MLNSRNLPIQNIKSHKLVKPVISSQVYYIFGGGVVVESVVSDEALPIWSFLTVLVKI